MTGFLRKVEVSARACTAGAPLRRQASFGRLFAVSRPVLGAALISFAVAAVPAGEFHCQAESPSGPWGGFSGEHEVALPRWGAVNRIRPKRVATQKSMLMVVTRMRSQIGRSLGSPPARGTMDVPIRRSSLPD